MSTHAIVGALCVCVVIGSAGIAATADDDVSLELSAEVRAKCLQRLREVFAGDDFWPAMHAAEGLTLAGQTAAVRTVLSAKLATETDDQRRCGLAREITRTGDRSALPVLFQILANPASNGRIHAAESLYKVAEIGDGQLLRQLYDQAAEKKLRQMSAAALARAGNLNALSSLRHDLNNETPEVRMIAAWAIGQLGSPDDLPALKLAYYRESDPVNSVFMTHALACLQEPAAQIVLEQNLLADNPATRTYAADFAGYVRRIRRPERLIAMLDDPHLDARARAAQSLIVLSLPRSELGLPQYLAADNFAVDVFPATEQHPRYSEGSIITLRDGSLAFAITEFDRPEDHATARLVMKRSTDGGRTWGPQQTLIENEGRQNVMSVTLRRLHPTSEQAPIGVFYLLKNSPTDLQVLVRLSTDELTTLGPPTSVTTGPGYHVMNNDRVAVLSTGRLVCPVAWTADVSKGGIFESLCFLSDDHGRSWRAGADRVRQPKRGAMEPEVIELGPGKLRMIMRTQLGVIATSDSTDGGDHWSPPSRMTLQAPEAPATIRTVPATGRDVLIWNNVFDPNAGHGGKRTPLTLGSNTKPRFNLEDDPNHGYAYTSLLFHRDRLLLSYYVSDATGRISTRFRSVPTRHLEIDLPTPSVGN